MILPEASCREKTDSNQGGRNDNSLPSSQLSAGPKHNT